MSTMIRESVAKLQRERDYLESALLASESQLQHFKSTISKYQATINDLEKSKTENDLQVKKLTSEKEQHRLEFEAFRTQNENLKQAYTKNEADVQTMRTENAALKTQLEELRQKSRDDERKLANERGPYDNRIKLYEKDRQEMRQKLDQIGKQLDSFSEQHFRDAREIAGLKDEIEGNRDEITSLKGSLKKETTKNEKVRTQIETQIKEFRASMTSKDNDIRKKTSALTEMETRLNNIQKEFCQLEEDLKIEKMKVDKLQQKQAMDKLDKERQDHETYQAELSKTRREIEQLKAKHTSSDNPYVIEELQQELAMKESRYEDELLLLRKELKLNQQSYRELTEEHSRLVDRFAAEMNERDERELENISIQARPMKIAEDYTVLMSHYWLDAKSELDEVEADDKTDTGKIMFLFDVLMTSESEAKAMHRSIMQEMCTLLRNPTQMLIKGDTKEGAAGGESEYEKDLPSTLLAAITDYLRRTSGTVDLKHLRQRVEAALKTKYAENRDAKFVSNSLKLGDVTNYMDESVQIAWKMTIQRPPMTFDVSQRGQKWQKESQLELIWGSKPNAKNTVIQYYKGPTLLHAGNTMVKGSVFVHYEMNP